MARAQSPDSAGSQFFICVKDSPFLDRQYTVFGEVESGMEAVDKIVSQPRDPRDNPNERIEMKVKIVEGKEQGQAYRVRGPVVGNCLPSCPLFMEHLFETGH
jgi:cyclophilin family peptidyl-prolyl cis-trans isomerase